MSDEATGQPAELMMLGKRLCDEGRLARGIDCFRRALEQDPENAAAHTQLGIALLTLGELPTGSAHYEWRWRRGGPPAMTAPLWDGRPLPGKTLLLLAEQGLGDTIQFVRYAALLHPRVGRLILHCPSSLIPLLRAVPGLELVADTAEPPPCDAYLPLLGVMKRLGTTLATIPNATPYLMPDRDRAAVMDLGPGVKVGLVWSGDRPLPDDEHGSLTLAALEPLLALPAIRFFNLQGPRAAEAQAFAGRITDLSSRLNDFADIAAAISEMDLVIAVDAAVAHLAGALGLPVWVMLRTPADWRWLVDRADSPWYPTMRLFRQTHPGDWAPVIAEVAVALIQQLIDGVQPPRPGLLNDLAIQLRRLGRLDQAILCLGRVIALRPELALAHNNLGLLLQEGGRAADAIAAYRRAIALDPDYPDGHNNLAVALDKAGHAPAALPHYRRALELAPDHAEALTNFGNRLLLDGAIEDAIALQRRSIARRPDRADAFSNLGFALRTAGQYDEAIATFRQAIALRPDYVEAHVNLALALLTIGDFRAGTAEYAWRWRGYQGAALPKLAMPLWDGRPLGDQPLLLWAEQGFGDTIQFVRYASLLRPFAGRILLACQAALMGLMTGAAGIDEVVSIDQPMPAAAAFIPLLDLMQRLDTVLETIPAPAAYLVADQRRAAALAPALPRGAPAIGLAWAGNPGHGNDRWRSIAPDLLKPILAVEGVRFVSLQHGPRGAEIPAGVVDLAPPLLDFADTAAVISRLDLVITVDTSVAHLAGALGRPVWVMLPANPDWRWLVGREDTPWYPTMRLFRQEHLGDWAPVVDRVAAALTQTYRGQR